MGGYVRDQGSQVSGGGGYTRYQGSHQWGGGGYMKVPSPQHARVGL